MPRDFIPKENKFFTDIQNKRNASLSSLLEKEFQKRNASVIEKAKANNMTINNIPVYVDEKSGELKYDVDAIGSSFGLTAKEIQTIKDTNVKATTRLTRDQIESGAKNPTNVDAMRVMGDNPTKILLHNLYNLKPADFQVNLTNERQIMNLGRFGAVQTGYEKGSYQRGNELMADLLTHKNKASFGEKYIGPALTSIIKIGAAAVNPFAGAAMSTFMDTIQDEDFSWSDVGKRAGVGLASAYIGGTGNTFLSSAGQGVLQGGLAAAEGGSTSDILRAGAIGAGSALASQALNRGLEGLGNEGFLEGAASAFTDPGEFDLTAPFQNPLRPDTAPDTPTALDIERGEVTGPMAPEQYTHTQYPGPSAPTRSAEMAQERMLEGVDDDLTDFFGDVDVANARSRAINQELREAFGDVDAANDILRGRVSAETSQNINRELESAFGDVDRANESLRQGNLLNSRQAEYFDFGWDEATALIGGLLPVIAGAATGSQRKRVVPSEDTGGGGSGYLDTMWSTSGSEDPFAEHQMSSVGIGF